MTHHQRILKKRLNRRRGSKRRKWKAITKRALDQYKDFIMATFNSDIPIIKKIDVEEAIRIALRMVDSFTI